MFKDSFFHNALYALNQESKEFIEAYPQLSQSLAEPHSDPDIHRTLDAFAYLTALLNAKLMEESPQLTLNLMHMLWPNYLQHTPSITIMEFTTHHDHTTMVAAGEMIVSSKAQSSDFPCTFSVCRETAVSPFTLHNIEQCHDNEIILHFYAPRAVNLTQHELNNQRLFCGYDQYAGPLIYLWLAKYFNRAALLVNDQTFTLHTLTFDPIGLKKSEAILVYPGNTFDGYRLLHEYFCYPEGLLFFDVKGIPDYFSHITTQNFALKLSFDRPLPNDLKVRQGLIKNNCSPAINLFLHDCEPIRLTGYNTEYPLTISFAHKEKYELFVIEQVTGWIDHQSRHYALFDSFRHQTELNAKQLSYYYHVNRKPLPNSDEIHYSLTFVRGDEAETYGDDEIISIQALCSNGDTAHHLSIGSICCTDARFAEGIQAKNITYPSKAIRPTLHGSQQWATISSLSLNYLSLLNKASLSQILQNYNFTTLYSYRAEKRLEKLLSGISQFTSKQISWPYQEAMVHGHESTIDITPTAFSNEGEMYLFGTILAQFYAQSAPINSFHFLTLRNSSTHEVYQWQLMAT